MTRQSTFKRKVRARMEKTGESYTAARRQLIGAGETPDSAPAYEPRLSDDTVRAATGRSWDEWFAILDEWGARDRPHKEIAAWLRSRGDISGWWSQSVTVTYEQARGIRAPGQMADGFAITASKTISAPLEIVMHAFDDPAERERWLPGAELHRRKTTAARSARYDWEDGATRVGVWFEAKGDDRSVVSVSHERLPDADAADAMKTYWRERLQVLKAHLES
jgi:hypothetical protein